MVCEWNMFKYVLKIILSDRCQQKTLTNISPAKIEYILMFSLRIKYLIWKSWGVPSNLIFSASSFLEI